MTTTVSKTYDACGAVLFLVKRGTEILGRGKTETAALRAAARAWCPARPEVK